MKLEHDRYTLHPKIPFTIARGTMTAYERVRVRLIDDGASKDGARPRRTRIIGKAPRA